MKSTLSKRQFILSCPKKLSAREIVDRALARGVLLSQNYVYVVRSEAASAVRKASKAVAAPVSSGFASQNPPLRARPRLTAREFVAVAAQLGIVRSNELLAHVRQGL